MNSESTNKDIEDKRDNLQDIKGIGPDYERALQQIGVLTFTQLAAFEDAQQLLKALERSGIEIAPWKIEKYSWIDQARAKVNNPKSRPEIKKAIASNHNQAIPSEEHAAFIVSFDRHISKNGEDSWLMVVSHAETEKPLTQFSMPYRTNPSAWIKDVFEEADKTEKSHLPENELVVTHVPLTKANKQLNLVDVYVTPSSTDVPQRELTVRVDFELLGSEVETWIEEMPFCRLELFLLDLERHAAELVTSTQKKLQPGILAYEISEDIPIPSPGKYELYTLLFSLPPTEMMMVTRQGPKINVVPHPVSAQ